MPAAGAASTSTPATWRRRSMATNTTTPAASRIDAPRERHVEAVDLGLGLAHLADHVGGAWSAASDESTARPSEPPTCWAVLSRPEARP